MLCQLYMYLGFGATNNNYVFCLLALYIMFVVSIVYNARCPVSCRRIARCASLYCRHYYQH